MHFSVCHYALHTQLHAAATLWKRDRHGLTHGQSSSGAHTRQGCDAAIEAQGQGGLHRPLKHS